MNSGSEQRVQKKRNKNVKNEIRNIQGGVAVLRKPKFDQIPAWRWKLGTKTPALAVFVLSVVD